MDKLLLFGGNGLVGSRFIELFSNNFKIKSPLAEEVDISNKESVDKIIEDFDPQVVINFAAYTNVEGAEEQVDNKEGICYQVNVIGAKNIAKSCKNKNKYLIHISTDYVFDGKKEIPYIEEDTPNPINWYGMTKYLAEEEVKKEVGQNCIVRISMPFRARYGLKKDIARFFLEQLKNNHPVKGIYDQQNTFTFIDDITKALVTLIEKRITGIYHVSSLTPASPFELAKLIARNFGLDESLINKISQEDYYATKKAKPLKNSALDSAKFNSEFKGILHTLEDSVVLFKQAVDGEDIN